MVPWPRSSPSVHRPGYVKDEEGALRIHVFMASIPADGEDLKFAQEGPGWGHVFGLEKWMDFVGIRWEFDGYLKFDGDLMGI